MLLLQSIVLGLASIILVLACLSYRKIRGIRAQLPDVSLLFVRIEDLQRSQSQIVEAISRELSLNRQESFAHSQGLRADLLASGTTVAESLTTGIDSLIRSTDQKLELLRNTVDQRLDKSLSETSRSNDQLAKSVVDVIAGLKKDLSDRLSEFQSLIDAALCRSADALRDQTQFITTAIQTLQTDTDQRQSRFASFIELKLAGMAQDSTSKLSAVVSAMNDNAKQVREEMNGAMKQLGDTVIKTLTEMTTVQKTELHEMRGAVDSRLASIQAENEKKLEQMRQTVDEKLQGTLEARLGESFKVVSQRLEDVYKGLGEMRSLASGVGDLKKVLTNVKTRGTWGEVQLGALLEQMMAPDQYAANVATSDNGERVEFAIKLPGRNGNDSPVWLPIDAKFPVEDYQRLIDAAEQGDPDATEQAIRQLEGTLKSCARTISDKYIVPPMTTDFAILFLPTEGLYAEAMRRPGLSEVIQREHRVALAGPSTLAALLNSLQMGFRTLAIQQRSSEVWDLLGAVKAEFGKYADVLAKVRKKLNEATNTIDKAETRTRVIHRHLRSVESTDSACLISDDFGVLEEEDQGVPAEAAAGA